MKQRCGMAVQREQRRLDGRGDRRPLRTPLADLDVQGRQLRVPASSDLGDRSSELLDPDGRTHRRYGATAEALYLVRPDGHVGLRAQPASEEVLLRYLGRVFDRVGAGAPEPAPPSATRSSR